MTHKSIIIGSAPTSPGVYLMKNAKGRVLYVGKAKNLKKRVTSYFTGSSSSDRYQIQHLLNDVSNIEYIVTQNERDALILENSLIKKYKPKFNVQFKDDKTYYSLKLDINEKYPRLFFTRRVVDDGALYFGPFTSSSSLKKTKKFFHKLFPLRDCTNSKFKRHSNRPCINYNMKLCAGPCAKKVSDNDYLSLAMQAKLYLRGKFKEILKLIENSMKNAAADLRFEEAAIYRNQLSFLKMHIDQKGLIDSKTKDIDVIGIYREGYSTSIVVLYFRNGSIMDKSDHFFENSFGDSAQILEEFIYRYYLGSKSYPKEICINLKLNNSNFIKQWLREKSGRAINLFYPVRGRKVDLTNLANENAKACFLKNFHDQNNFQTLLNNLSKKLSLNNTPETIECYDISNIQGTNSVASSIRFEDGKALKRRYRRYKIKTISGANDFAMIGEVISRRLQRKSQKGWDLPDLFLIDGGIGQLNSALSAAAQNGSTEQVDIVAIAKARNPNETDKIFIPYNSKALTFKKNSKEILYLMKIRDEAHRFAVDYHKKLRKKSFIKSAFQSIPMVGVKRKKILQKKYRTINNLKNVSAQELASIDGFNTKVAESIKNYISSANL